MSALTSKRPIELCPEDHTNGALAIHRNAKTGLAEPARSVAEARSQKSSAGAEASAYLETITADTPIATILAKRLRLTHENMAVEIGADTPLEEYLHIFDHFFQLGQHVGFLIGDVICFGQKTYRKYGEVLKATGRALDTLRAYVNVANHVPPHLRKARLSFSVHREVAKLKDSPDKMAEILKDADEKAQAGVNPTVIEIRAEVTKFLPERRLRKRKAREASVSRPSESQRAALDVLLEQLESASLALHEDKLDKAVLQLDEFERRSWHRALSLFVRVHEKLEESLT
jgi:hypothetical protein